ncbi:Ig-like domain-containing protein [Dyadobacter tibetensis]|uniref:Ig-like domain-containing protein n=1 Tax=Dyadobacter tibetensis TaxID=1211851 RepID=UPI0004719D83|nr:Ig-like domain-containing protein [Dyadobacter tibetensis]
MLKRPRTLAMLFIAFLFLGNLNLQAQSSNAPANTFSPLITNTYSNLTVTSSTVLGSDEFSNKNRLIDANLENASTWGYAIASSAWISVKDNNATGSNVYPAGSYAGFVLSNDDIAVFGNSSIKTYLNGTLQEDKDAASLISLGLLGGGAAKLGFFTSKPFNEIRYDASAVGIGTKTVYYAEVKRFAKGPGLNCNEPTALTSPAHPLKVETSLSTTCLVCSFTNTNAVIDNDANTAATLSTTAAVAGSASLTVTNPIDSLPLNTFAGFDIESNSLLSLDVLSGIQITLLNNGAVVQTSPANLVLAGVSSLLVTDPSRQRIGIVSNTTFDAVKITFDLPLSVNLGSVKIYGLVVEKLCAATLACNKTYDWGPSTFPTIINSQATGVTGLASVGGTVANPWNVINGVDSDFATLSTTVGVGGAVTLAVLDPLSTYPIGTTAGFAIDIPSGILKLNLFNNLSLKTYLDGVLQETIQNSQLLELSLLANLTGGSPNEPYNIGFVAQKPFDELRITVNSLASLLNSVRVYSAFIDTRTILGAGGLVCLNTLPDFNVTYPGIATTGRVNTNDVITGTVTYGIPMPTIGNPSGASITMNPDGSYTFNGTAPGVYKYQVPVCLTGQTSDCATESLRISVLDKDNNTNLPAANPDYAYAKGAPSSPSSIMVKIGTNDGPGNIGGTLATPTISVQPVNGTASIDGSGNMVYTPNPGFYGTDIITYQVCESPSLLCTTTTVQVSVLAPGVSDMVAAADDYVTVGMNKTLTRTEITGVLSNDNGPTGETLTVVPQNTNIPGVGTLNLLANGSYTFTPEPGYFGPANFTYQTCATGSDCSSATLYILVQALPDLTPAQLFSGSQLKINNLNTLQYVVAISNVGNASTGSTITFTVSKFPSGSGITLTPALLTSYTIYGTSYALDNSDFNIVDMGTEYVITSKTPTVKIPAQEVKYVGFLIGRIGGTAETLMNTVNIPDGSGGESSIVNNVIINPVTKL